MRLTLLRAKPQSGGFSLLEVIVALAILGVGVVALIELLSSSLRTVKKTEEYSRALLHARSVMDEAYASPDIEGLESSISFKDGMSAERTITKVSTMEGASSPAGATLGGPASVQASLYEIRVSVRWGPSGMLELVGQRAVHESPE